MSLSLYLDIKFFLKGTLFVDIPSYNWYSPITRGFPPLFVKKG